MGIIINRRRVMGNKKEDPYAQYVVDLGLPSGILWMDRNIGANESERYGLYFSWGNIDGHAAGSGYNFSQATYDNTTGSQITTDIPLSKDAANVYYGGDWRMPTKMEFQELYDNCNSDWVVENGVRGRRFTSKTNGNSVFFPAAGYYDYSLNQKDIVGCYWSVSYNSKTDSYSLNFRQSYNDPQYSYSRKTGFSIRAVRNK